MINICETCRHRYKRKDQEPCKECCTGINWEPKETENEEKKEEKGKEDKDFEWPCFEKLHESVREAGKDIEKAMEGTRIKLEKRPGLLAFPVPVYESTNSEIPEKVRISFTNGTSAIYELRVDQPAPQVVECIRIIRKWNNGYKAPTRRRRRK